MDKRQIMEAMMRNCHMCGKFCKPDCDYSIPFGGYDSYEPPPEEFYCEKCAIEQEERYVKAGFVPISWIKADWERRVAERLGYVEIKLGDNAWSVWHRDGLPLPEGYHNITRCEDD